MSSSLENWVNESLERQRTYAHESLKVDVSEEIYKAMDAAGVTKAELARRLGCSRPNVQGMLDGKHSMTLRTLADIARVLGCSVELKLKRVR